MGTRGPQPGTRHGGRQKGTRNKVTDARREHLQKVAQELEELLPGAFEGDGHAFLMAVYKDPRQPMNVRIDAAKAAVGYEKPRLQAVEMNANVDISQEDRLSLLERRANGSAAAYSQ
jgi:hypothetical protein